jgi:microcystin-dependent protein
MPNVRVLNNQKLEFFKENRVVPHAIINVDDNGLLVSSNMQIGGNLRVNGSIEATILKGELPAHTHNVADIIGGVGQQNTFSSIALYNSEGLPVPNSPYFALTPNDTITLKASGNISFAMESNGTVTIDDTHYHDPGDISGIDAWIESNPTVVSNTNSRHSHSNKALLDSYTQTEASLADAVNKKHDRTHGLLSADHLVVGLTAGHILMATGSTTVEFKALEASHIPNLDWSKITTGKPTTLSGYGITDAYTKTELETSGTLAVSITGNAATATNATNATNVTTNINGMAITNIFESDKKTVKKATSATSANNGVPPGSVFPYAGLSAPTGYLLCYGQAVSRTTYSALFAVIGTTYGAGNGSTTFNVPDLRGRVIIGLDNMGGISANRVLNNNADVIGGSGGEEKHTLTVDEMPSHNHTYTSERLCADGTTQYGDTFRVTGDTPSAGSDIFTSSSSGNGLSHNNMQPWIALNYIIKY